MAASVNEQGVVSGFHAFGPEIQLLAFQENFNIRGSFNLALNQSFREGVFDVFLQRAPYRPRTVQPVCAGLIDDPTLSLGRQPDFKTMTAHRLVNLIKLQLDDFQQLVVEQLVEDDDLVQTIDELRIEGLPY